MNKYKFGRITFGTILTIMWNGELPQFVGGSSTIPILNVDENNVNPE